MTARLVNVWADGTIFDDVMIDQRAEDLADSLAFRNAHRVEMTDRQGQAITILWYSRYWESTSGPFGVLVALEKPAICHAVPT